MHDWSEGKRFLGFGRKEKWSSAARSFREQRVSALVLVRALWLHLCSRSRQKSKTGGGGSIHSSPLFLLLCEIITRPQSADCKNKAELQAEPLQSSSTQTIFCRQYYPTIAGLKSTGFANYRCQGSGSVASLFQVVSDRR